MHKLKLVKKENRLEEKIIGTNTEVNKYIARKHEIERKFHDNWARSLKTSQVNYREAFEGDTAIENKFAISHIGEIKGKKILDLGCGVGDASLYFASHGAQVYSIDISLGMIKFVKRLAKEKGFSKSITSKMMKAEDLKFPGRYFDFVFGNGILHHVSIAMALDEVYRVLKHGGIATFIEPLGHNPIINIYRKMADKVRTPTETPLNYAQLDILTKAKFTKIIHREFQLTTLLIFLWYFLFENVNPNKERYWKRIIDDASRIKTPFLILKVFDDIIFRVFPFLRKYCWNTVLVYQK